MAVDFKKLKAGDKVRYLGGDVMGGGERTIADIYEVIGKDYAGRPYIKSDEGYNWHIYGYNAHCFELVDDDKSESTCKCASKHDLHIASLAKEVAKLKRELAEHKEYVEKEVVLLDERLIEVESKKPSADKTQYVTVYGSEYIDKLFGGDGE